jgi:hypothetical protein
VYIKRVVDWLGGDGEKARTVWRIACLVVMFVAGIVFGIKLIDPHRPSSAEKGSFSESLVRYVVASGAAILVLKFVNPVKWLRLFATDYLIGFVLLAGILLTVAALGEAQARQRAASIIGRRGAVIFRPYSFATALIAAGYVIVVLGFAVSSHIVHMSLSGDRWWRFPCIAAAGLPLFFADEAIIRPLRPRWKSILAALVTRALLLAFLLVGVLILDRENAFLFLIAPLITIFWIGLWFASGTVHRGTENALATALFAALVQGWAFAAWFVTI